MFSNLYKEGMLVRRYRVIVRGLVSVGRYAIKMITPKESLQLVEGPTVMRK